MPSPLFPTLAELMADAESAPIPEETQEELARRQAKRDAEWAKGIRLGWHDADGNPIPQPDDNDEDDEE
jgi:hypothetical protein